jgi:hypothetical protein
MAPYLHYWWAVLLGTVSVPIVGGAFWKQVSLAHARWRSTHARSDRERTYALEVLRLENPDAASIPSYLELGHGSAPPSALSHASSPSPSGIQTQVRIPDLVSNPVPDARRTAPGIAQKELRTGPRHAAVWVRVGGHWRRGRVIEWVRQIDHEEWDCVILADESACDLPWQGRYFFDPRAIRPRCTEQPPE